MNIKTKLKMKIKAKSFLVAMLFVATCAVCFADESLSDVWKKFGSSAKDAAKTLGSALAETGKQLGEELDEALGTNYTGEWVFDSGKTVTTIKCTEDKKMEITQKTGTTTNFWQGTSSGAVAFIKFHIEKSGSQILFIKKNNEIDETWWLSYSLSEDKNTLFVQCEKLPDTADDHSFANETAFIRKK